MMNTLLSLAKNNKNMVLLHTDAVDCDQCQEVAKFFPDRSFSFGLSEANMISCAAGFALAGKLPFVIGNSEFLLSRAFDQFYNDVCVANLNVKVIAMGKSDLDDKLLKIFPNLRIISEDEDVYDLMLKEYGPMYFQKI